MKTIYFENGLESNQDERKVYREVMQAILDGKNFELIVDDGDGDIWTHNISNYSEYSFVDPDGLDDELNRILK